MAKICHIRLSGIRSFSPDTLSTMEFFTPLTLILGQNGCGKTTIIEALKYITTGGLPPGCSKGGSFGHDPKISGEATVLAKIQILISLSQGDMVSCTRLADVIQKPKSIEFKTKDSTIKRKKPNGTMSTLSGRCADFVAEMTSMLGVSKSILENVIFCHQEESNWPLDEGKKVKDKFDEIFNATKYIKCMKSLRDQRKNLLQKVKVLDELLEGDMKWKQEAVNKRKEMTTKQTDVDKLDRQKETLKFDLDPLMTRMQEISSIEYKIADITGNLRSNETQLRINNEAQKELREKMNEPIACSDEKLFQMLLDFEHDMSEKNDKLENAEAEMLKVERDLDRCKKNESTSIQKLGQLEASQTVHLDNLAKRNKCLTDVVNMYSFLEYAGKGEFDSTEAGGVINMLSGDIDKQRIEVGEKTKEFTKKIDDIQSEINKMKAEEAALDHDIKNCTKQMDELSRNILVTKKKLLRQQSDVSDTSVNEIQRQIKEVVDKLNTEKQKMDQDEVRAEIKTITQEKSQVERKLKDIKKIVAKMNRQAEDRSKYDIHLKEKKHLEDSNKNLIQKHEDELEQLLGEVPTENYLNKLDACTNDLFKQSTKLRLQRDSLETKKTRLETQIKSQRQQEDRKQTEVKRLQDKIEQICQGNDLDAALEKSKKLIESMGKKQGELSSSISILNRYSEKLKQRNCCPLCHRSFEEEQQVAALIEELQEKVSRVPKRLEEVKRKVEDQKEQYDQFTELKPQRERLNNAIKELDTIKSDIATKSDELKKIKEELENVTETWEVVQCDEETSSRIKSSIVIIENNCKTIKQRQNSIAQLQSMLGSDDIEMTMDDAMDKQTELEKQINDLQEEVTKKTDTLYQYRDMVANLQTRKNDLAMKEIEIKEKLKEVEDMKVEMTRMEEQKIKVSGEKEASEEKIAPYKYDIRNKEDSKANATKERNSWLERENKKIEKVTDQRRAVTSLNESVCSYERRGGDKDLENCRSRVTTLQEISSKQENRRKLLDEETKRLQKELAYQMDNKRNLEDEKSIRDKQVEAKKLERDIESLSQRINKFNWDTVVKEKNDLNNKVCKIQRQHAELNGQMEAITAQIKDLKKQLQRKEFQNAEKDYKNKLIKRMCTNIAAEDLNKYYKALETAIMKFHHGKMATINGIIRDLWRTTYRGNDIDYIEIKTDESEATGADKRRTYNYRVIMVKNCTEMNMRGRCSAGQKVLASLIIRMALAETFSTNCGILALDEPTTNLDRENIDALSNALLNIVKRRSNQSNFQLIVITHDDEFLASLTRSEYISHYYRVSRNPRGLSQIEKLDATTL